MAEPCSAARDPKDPGAARGYGYIDGVPADLVAAGPWATYMAGLARGMDDGYALGVTRGAVAAAAQVAALDPAARDAHLAAVIRGPDRQLPPCPPRRTREEVIAAHLEWEREIAARTRTDTDTDTDTDY